MYSKKQGQLPQSCLTVANRPLHPWFPWLRVRPPSQRAKTCGTRLRRKSAHRRHHSRLYKRWTFRKHSSNRRTRSIYASYVGRWTIGHQLGMELNSSWMVVFVWNSIPCMQCLYGTHFLVRGVGATCWYLCNTTPDQMLLQVTDLRIKWCYSYK